MKINSEDFDLPEDEECFISKEEYNNLPIVARNLVDKKKKTRENIAAIKAYIQRWSNFKL